MSFTTNSFQAFDVPLTNGANVLTFHATDRNGNVTTTNITYTLNYSGKPPPAIQVFWPQNGDTVTGTTFTLRGSLNDFTASLTAQIVDASGDTNVIQGVVERNGLFWVENAPLADGLNYITLTVMDAVTNVVTNLTVTCLGGAVTIDDFTARWRERPIRFFPRDRNDRPERLHALGQRDSSRRNYGRERWEAARCQWGRAARRWSRRGPFPTPRTGATARARCRPRTARRAIRRRRAAWPPKRKLINRPIAICRSIILSALPPRGYQINYCTGCDGTSVSVGTGQVDDTSPWTGGTASHDLANSSSSSCADSSSGWDNHAFAWPCDACPGTAVETYNSPTTGAGTNAYPDDMQDALYNAQEGFHFGAYKIPAHWEFEDHVIRTSSDACSDGAAIYDDTQCICSQMTLQTGGKGIPARAEPVPI